MRGSRIGYVLTMDALEIYLRNHWAGAGAGVDFARRVARSHSDPEVARVLDGVAQDIAEDRDRLARLMDTLGVDRGHVMPLAARAVERLGRLKPNGRIVQRSPVSDVLEIEGLRSAVIGKRAGWESLRALARDDSRLDVAVLDALIVRADDQLRRLEEAHTRSVEAQLVTPRGPG